jgi:tetratricopeptide (TPR) repeat protein
MEDVHRTTFASMMVLACALGAAPLSAQGVSVRDCLDVPADTSSEIQLSAVIRLCTIVLQGKELSAAQRADVLVHRGVAYRNLDDFEKSTGDLRAARELTPDDPMVSRMLGWTWREMGRLEEAEAELTRSIKLEPHPQGFLARCFVRFSLGKLADALADCETVHGVDPSEDSAYMTARLYKEAGRATSAVPLLEGVIGTALESGRVYGLLAEVYAAGGRADDARRIKEQGMLRFPKDPTLSLPAEQ